jgi:hypothetical protein
MAMSEREAQAVLYDLIEASQDKKFAVYGGNLLHIFPMIKSGQDFDQIALEPESTCVDLDAIKKYLETEGKAPADFTFMEMLNFIKNETYREIYLKNIQ